MGAIQHISVIKQPSGLKPVFLAYKYVRAKARTLHKSFFRSP